MHCCEDCFNDDFLKRFIRDSGALDDCDFCGAQHKHCIEPSRLQKLFLPLASLYEGVINFMPVEQLKVFQGDYLWDKFNEQWEVFAFYDGPTQERLVRAIGASSDSRDDSIFELDDFVEKPDEYWGDDVERQQSFGYKWKNFCDEIKYQNRFFQKGRLEIIEELLPNCELLINKGNGFYRARPCGSTMLTVTELGKPQHGRNPAGRGNPEGISYLYLASDEDTALAEAKPYLEEHLTIGNFLAPKDLRVIDLRNPSILSPFEQGDRLKFLVDNLFILRMLGNELSKPIKPNSGLEYLPTQYLCEFIKSLGYEGVVYGSSVAAGYNLMVFSDKGFVCSSRNMYKVTNIVHSKVLVKTA